MDLISDQIERKGRMVSDSGALTAMVLNHYPETQAIYLFGTYGTEYERPESDADIALLLPPHEAKSVGTRFPDPLYADLELFLGRRVDLINLRRAPTVLQKEVVAADRCIFAGNRNALEEFEMLTLSNYQKLNEERKEIVQDALAGGRFFKV